MKTTEILLQGEGILDIKLIRIEHGKRVSEILEVARNHRNGGFDGEFVVFLEDDECPLDLDAPLPETEPGKPLRLHVHRCLLVDVTVNYNGRPAERRFRPGATVQLVKLWAVKELGLAPADAAEHVLQIAGTSTQPELDTHIGTLATNTDCKLRFNLVPKKRVEG